MNIEWERSRYAWMVVGLVLGAVVVYVAYSFVGTLVFGVFIYYASRPVYRRMKYRIDHQSVAAMLALAGVIIPILLLLAYTFAIGLQEFGRLAERVDLGVLEQTVQPYLDIATVVENPGSILQDPDMADSAGAVAGAAFDSLGFIGTGLLHLFIMFALAYYLLKDGARLRRWIERRFADSNGVLSAFFMAVYSDLYRVFSGNIYNALFTGILGAFTYSLLNVFAPAGTKVPYPALVGLLGGAASLVPVVGMKLVYVPVGAYLFGIQFFAEDPIWWPAVAFVLLSFVVVDTIPDFIVRPMVSGSGPPIRKVDGFPFYRISLSTDGGLHVGLIMFAYILGPLLFGWYGLFLGPMILVVLVHFSRLILPELLNGETIQPYAVDPAAAEPEPDPEPKTPEDTGIGPSDVDTATGG